MVCEPAREAETPFVCDFTRIRTHADVFRRALSETVQDDRALPASQTDRIGHDPEPAWTLFFHAFYGIVEKGGY